MSEVTPRGDRHSVRFGVAFRLFGALLANAVLALVAIATALYAFQQYQDGFDRFAVQSLPTLIAASELAERSQALSANAPNLAAADSHFAREAATQSLRKQLSIIAGVTERLASLAPDTPGLAQLLRTRADITENMEKLDRSVGDRIDADSLALDLTLRFRNLSTRVHTIDAAQLSKILDEGTRAEINNYHSSISTIDQAIVVALSTVTADTTTRLNGLQSNFDSLRDKADALDRLHPPRGAPLTGMVRALDQYGSGEQSIFSAREHQLTSMSAVREALLEGQELSSQFVASTEDMFSAVRRTTHLQSEFFSSEISHYNHIFIGIACLCLLGGGAVFFYINKSIVVRLRRLSESMRARSEGQNVSIPTSGSDELADMARATQFFVAAIERREAQLAAEMEQLNSVFQSTGAGILLLDGQANVVLANQFVLDTNAKTAAEAAGRPYSELVPDGLDPVVIERWQSACGTERLKPVEFERVIDTNGAKRLMKVTANPIQDDAGRLRYIVIIGVDDTERRLGEIRLFDSSRLANLGEMATGMAHEINQPLAVIRMAADSLLEELETPEAIAVPAELAAFIKGKLDRISKQTERASSLVDDLRAVARKPTNDSVPFDVGEAARIGGDLLHEQLKAARIEFTVDLAPAGLMVRGEASRLQQVIINLVLNARDALLEDPSRSSTGTLGHIALRVAAAAGSAVLTIEDDGSGIPASVLPRLFEPFFTTKPTGKGTGLGLSISYDIIKRMGGNITAENRPEGGARFIIVLPAAHEDFPDKQLMAA